MNPLLFADWGRMNRLFTKIMWTVAAIMVCVVFAVLASAGGGPRPTAAAAHSTPAARSAGVAVGAAPGAAGVMRPSRSTP